MIHRTLALAGILAVLAAVSADAGGSKDLLSDLRFFPIGVWLQDP
jgi:hypothetical protein